MEKGYIKIIITVLLLAFLFYLSPLPNHKEELSLGDTNTIGDVNNDGKVNTLDYIMIRKHLTNISNLTQKEIKRADVDGDNKVGILDYIMIRKIILGINVPLPTATAEPTPVPTQSSKPIESYTITFNANGGSVSTKNMTIKKGDAYGTLPTPTRSGYRFIGWFTSKDGEFDAKYYADLYSDLKSAFNYDYQQLLNHWFSNGLKEGRICSKTNRNKFSSYNLNSNETLYARWESNIVNERVKLEDLSNAVGIGYSTSFNPVLDSLVNPPKVVGKDAIEQDYIYYWGKPAIGFYRSDDKEVIKYHMNLLIDAGVDFIIIDNTNARPEWKNIYKWLGKANSKTSYWEEMITKSETALLDTLYEMNRDGIKTPKVVNWTTNNEDVINNIYNEFYKNSKYSNLWLYYENKPLYLTAQTPPSNSSFTMRKMNGLEYNRGENVWSFLEKNNKPSTNNEQISVSVAMQETYMTEPTATCRNGGKTFHDQWVNAFKAHPKVVTITWWNEWTAIAQKINGKIQFTDNYNTECSRDIEPMEGGHGDKYYKLMKLLISDYKNNKNIRSLNEYKKESGLK